ncbi:MAG TPA: hypothetical protein VK203_13120 [Nostocaceae cyanobacterium]|nr:hypothetical protein [Nostocaceae cyanobacterium]
MNKRFLPVHKILVATLTGFSFASLLVASPSLANPNQSGFGSLESDRNNNILSPNGSDFNMFDIIHNANLRGGQFDPQAAQQGINTEADSFKVKQQQRLQTQPTTNTVTPTTGNQPLEISIPINK